MSGNILRPGKKHIIALAGAPTITPENIGQIYINITTGAIYRSKGTTGATDWTPVATADGKAVVYNPDQDIYQVISVSGGAGLENVVIENFAG